MFGDLQTRAGRMNRLPPVTLRDYVEPVVYAVIALPFIWAGVVILSLV